MTYFVNDKCIKCKYTDCVEVCPVDCFYEHEHMLVIHPDECIDCGLCEPECPIDAIKSDADDDSSYNASVSEFVNLNRMLSEILKEQDKMITQIKDKHSEEESHRDAKDKMDLFRRYCE